MTLLQKASPGPFVPWFNRDANGHITESGIDVKDRWAGIAEFKMLTETVELEGAEADALIEADTRLLAAAWDAREILMVIHEYFRHWGPVDPSVTLDDSGRTLKNAVAAYIAKLQGDQQS